MRRCASDCGLAAMARQQQARENPIGNAGDLWRAGVTELRIQADDLA